MSSRTGTMCGSRGRSRLDPALSGQRFDRRQKAKAKAAANANGDLSAEASAQAEGEGDMFSAAGVAAE